MLKPKICIEPLMRDEISSSTREIEVYCFNGVPKIFLNVVYGENHREICYYDEDLNFIDLILHPDKNNYPVLKSADLLINQTIDLSRKLSEKFKFVRVDWIVFENKLYFNELTFSPYSGMVEFDKKWNEKMGEWIKFERNGHGF